MDKCPRCGYSPQESLELIAESEMKEVASLPLANGREYPVYDKMFDVWKLAYPGVDLVGEFLKIRAWLVSNPTRGKTVRGMPRFINNWLSKAQDNPRSNGNGNHSASVNRFVQAEREQINRVARTGRS